MNVIKVIFKYLKSYPGVLLAALFSILASSLFEGASFGMLIPIIRRMTEEGGSVLSFVPSRFGLSRFAASPNDEMVFIFGVMFIIIAVKNVFVYMSMKYTAKLKLMVTRDTSVNMMSCVLGYDMKYIDSMRIGNVIGAVTTETQRIGEFVQAVVQFITYLAKVAVYVALIFLISWKTSLAVFFIMAIVFVPIELIMIKLKKIGEAISEAISWANHILHEILGGFRLIRMSATEKAESERFAMAQEKVYLTNYRGTKFGNLIVPIVEVVIFGAIVIMFCVVSKNSSVSMKNIFPLLATYLVVLTKMLTQINAANGVRSTAISRLAAIKVYEDICDPNYKRTMTDGTKEIKCFSQGIEFKGVSFFYREGEYVLTDVDLLIPKGKIVALVGGSGSGKSTLVSLITRFYDVQEGGISVDGIPLKELTLASWRKKIGFVSQDTFIFNDSVKNNIAYGAIGSREEDIINAARCANAHEFILSLPKGYDTVLGDRGVTLSGGQKQRISIARAILHNPDILILDEATSSLDTHTEKLITEAVTMVSRGRTVIAIAHRLSTILHADTIIVMDRGRIVERGTHQELLAKNGYYKKLYETQFAKKEEKE